MTKREAGVAFLRGMVGLSPKSGGESHPKISKEDLKDVMRDLMSEESSESSSSSYIT